MPRSVWRDDGGQGACLSKGGRVSQVDRTLTFVVAGLVVAGVGGLIFYGGTRLLDRQQSRPGVVGSCLVAIIGAVIIFLGVGILAAAMLVG